MTELWAHRGQKRPAFADEPRADQESVWDYPRPPALVPDHRRVLVTYGATTIADSSRSMRVLEAASPPTFYVPPGDVRAEWLDASAHGFFCEWKGQATYWSLAVEGESVPDIGWSYPSPSRRFAAIAGYFSFYPSRVVCLVDGERVRPQPGGFYGGWVTDDVAGPFKGEPGTGYW